MSHLKERIFYYIARVDHASFYELSLGVDGFKGDYEFVAEVDGFEVVYWWDVSAESVEALRQLLAERLVFMNVDHQVRYEVHGIRSPYPQKKPAMKPPLKVWVPVTFSCHYEKAKKK